MRVAGLPWWNGRMMLKKVRKVKKEEKARVLRARNGSKCEIQDQSLAVALRDISMDSARPRRIDPRTKPGTSRSRVNDTLEALLRDSRRRSRPQPHAFRH